MKLANLLFLWNTLLGSEACEAVVIKLQTLIIRCLFLECGSMVGLIIAYYGEGPRILATLLIEVGEPNFGRNT